MLDVKFHEPVITKDGEKLGVAQRLYIKQDDEEVETQTVESHLKVFDFATGDDYYIPTGYIDARDSEGVKLSIKFQTVLNRSYSRLPRYIAYESMTVTELDR